MAATQIDCDIHPAIGGTRTTLLPYLDDHWKEQVLSRAIDGLDLTSYPPSMPLSGRPDWRPKEGKPGGDLAMVQRGACDQLGASDAICNVLYGAQAVCDPYMAAAFCKAINDWIAAEWPAREPRLRASIVVPVQAPALATEEIERRAGDNRCVPVEVPWIDREPAAIMRDHIRVTTQPFDSPPDADAVADIVDQIGSDKMFLFASDYPHWQFDGDDAIPPHLPDSIVSRMCADNPLETFPRLKLAA